MGPLATLSPHNVITRQFPNKRVGSYCPSVWRLSSQLDGPRPQSVLSSVPELPVFPAPSSLFPPVVNVRFL